NKTRNQKNYFRGDVMIVSPSLYPLIAALLANVAAQVLKLFNYYFRSGRWDLHQVISCGGFPSSHSSTVTALALAIGLQEGFTSALFAITCIFRSEEHTSELQSRFDLVCRLLLEKKNEYLVTTIASNG